MKIDFFQIGSHIGNTSTDKIFNLNFSDCSAILIEPVPSLFEKLKLNYEEKKKIITLYF